MGRVHAVGDLVPGRGGNLLVGFPAGGGQFEELLAAFGLGAHDQTLVDQQLQGRVDRPGAGLPQVLAALGDLLDDLVAVHRSLGEQDQDGGPDVTSTTAPAVATATSTARTGGEARTEARVEPAAESGSERTVVPAAVGPHQVAKFTAGLPALLGNGATVLRRETGGRRPRHTCERPGYVRPACFKKWVVHVVDVVSGKVASDALTICCRYIGSYR